MRRFRVAALVVLGGVLLTIPQTAGAVDDITFDPGSPAGKEYAIPLDEARREGGGDGGGGAGGAGSPPGAAGQRDSRGSPLFGAGTTPERPSGGSSSRPGRSSSPLGEATRARPDGRDVSRGGSGSAQSARPTGALSDVDKGLLTIGGAVLVLVVGSVAAVATGFASRRGNAS